MKTEIYACFGILEHEYETVYSVTYHWPCEKITVEIPESLKPYVTMTGSIAVMLPVPKSATRTIYKTLPYTLEETLTATEDGEPALKSPGYYCKLRVIEED